jgi:hypothetical protein
MCLSSTASTSAGSSGAFVCRSRPMTWGRSISARSAAWSRSPSVPMTGSPHCIAACRPARSSISTAAAWISFAKEIASISPASTFSDYRACWVFYKDPGRKRLRPFAHWRGSIRVLKLCKDSWRNDYLLEELGKQSFYAAQDEVVQRRGVRNDDAHERGKILPSAALSASRSSTE